MFTFTNDFNETKKYILPVIRGNEFRDVMPENIVTKEATADIHFEYRIPKVNNLVNANDDMLTSALITDDIIDIYNVTTEQLHESAMENVSERFPAVITPLSNMMQELGAPLLYEEEPTILVLTNEDKYYGASVLFYPGVLDKVRDLFNEDFYILPSSVHECLCIKKERQNVSDLLDMVTSINLGQVDIHDRLSNSVYIYEKGAGEIRKVA